jgi:hypothetical protein
MTEASTHEATLSDDVARVRKAFEELEDEIRAVPPEQIQQINIDIPSAVTSVLGAMPEIMSLRPRMIGLAEFSLSHLDKLEKYVLALDHAHTVFVMQSKPAAPLAELVARCTRKREILLADVQSAVVRGLIDGASLKELRGINSYRNIVFDLFALAFLGRSNWSALEGKTAITQLELLEAEQLADQLNVALGLREQGPVGTGEGAELRSRAYTLFIQAYNGVRRAVQYLEPARVDEIVPSIRVPRGPSKKRAEVEAPETGVVAPQPAPAEVEATDMQAIPIGMPGASPFVRS